MKKEDIKRAISLYQQSIAIEEEISNIQGKADTLNSLAIIYAIQGDIEEAITAYEQSIEIYDQIGNIQKKAFTVTNLEWLLDNFKRN